MILIRHGEKPTPDEGAELSERGWQRARALPALFHTRPELMTYGAPVALFAMGPKHEDSSVRAIETLKYVSTDLGLPINQQYTSRDVSQLVHDIRDNPRLNGRTVLICWNHDDLPEIAQTFGVRDDLKWKGHTFDRIWLIQMGTGPRGSSELLDLPQHLIAGDSEN